MVCITCPFSLEYLKKEGCTKSNKYGIILLKNIEQNRSTLMKSILKTAIPLVGACFAFFLTGCSEESTTSSESLPAEVKQQYAHLFHDEYVEICDLDIVSFPERDRALQQAYALQQTEKQYL